MRLPQECITVLESISQSLGLTAATQQADAVFKMCLRKKPYNTEEEAKKTCRAIWKRKKYYMKYYTCPICKSIHIATDLDRMWKKCK